MSKRIKTSLLIILGIFCLVCVTIGITACDAHTHSLESIAAKDATCTEDGNIACYHCTTCGNYYTDEETYHYVTSEEVVISALGHNFVDNVCTRCGQYESSIHEHGELRYVAAVEATCTESGKIGHWRCPICVLCYADEYGVTEISVLDTTIDPLGHDCEEYGYCVRCGINDPDFTAEATEGLNYELSEDGTYYSVSFGVDCTGLDIVIPESYNGKPVTAIADWGFTSEEITSIYIPASITYIGEGAFYSCPLESIVVSDDNEYYMSYFGNLYNRSGTTLIRYASGNPATSFEISKTVTRLEDYAFTNSDNLVSITIPNSVTYMGMWCFAFCDNLDNVVIPDSVTSIGDGLFDECISLTSVTLSSSLTVIGAYMFYNNYSLVTVKIPDGVTTIEFGAFAYCSALVNVIIPASVTEIGEAAFDNCLSLTEIFYTGTSEQFAKISENFDGGSVYYYSATMPDGDSDGFNYWCYTAEGVAQVWAYFATDGLEYKLSDDKTYYIVSGYGGTETDIYIPSMYEGLTVKQIGDYAFVRSDITSIYIPDAVITISSTAFLQCALLEYVYIGSGVKDIPAETFTTCSAISWFDVSARNTAYKSVDGDIYTIDGLTLVKYAVGKTDTSFTVEAAFIGKSAFYGSPYLTYIKITYTTTIGDYAFWGCASLETVILDETISSIGEYAFYGCSKLATVYYEGTESTLIRVSIGENNDPLYNSTIYFYLESMPDSGNYWRYVNGEPKEWPYTATEGLIYGNISYESPYAGVGDSYIYVTGYSGTETDIVIPDTYGEYIVKGIYNGAFMDNTSITSVRIGNNVRYIEGYAFSGCTAITDVFIGSSVVDINNDAFSGCTSLKSITIPDNVGSIGQSSFYKCTSLTKVVIGEGVSRIGSEAFFSCLNLTDVTLGSSVEVIGSEAFSGCGLSSITIPKSVTSIGQMAFNISIGHGYGYSAFIVYYQGTEDEWNAIEKADNSFPDNKTIYYNC